MGRWILVTSLLIAAIMVAFIILTATGVIDGPALFWRVGPKIGWLQPHLETYSRGLDSEEWIGAQEEELRRELAQLRDREGELTAWQKELELKSQTLDKREADLEKQLGQIASEQAQRRNVQTLAELYSEMSAADAANILQKLDHPLLLQVLLHMELQDAANILIQLPTDLAVTLSKRLGEAGK